MSRKVDEEDDPWVSFMGNRAALKKKFGKFSFDMKFEISEHHLKR